MLGDRKLKSYEVLNLKLRFTIITDNHSHRLRIIPFYYKVLYTFETYKTNRKCVVFIVGRQSVLRIYD